MKKLLLTCASSALIFTSSMANADFNSWFEETEVAANVRIATDYQFYGASQTSGNNGNDNGASIQGGFDITWAEIPFLNGSIYTGLFAANTEWSLTTTGNNPTDYSSIEFTHYHGIAGDSIGSTGISWDVGGIQYTYPNQSSDAGAVDDFDYWEIYGVLGYTFSDVMFEPSVSAGVFYSPAWFAFDAESVHIPLTLDLSLPYGLGLGFFFGDLDVDFEDVNNGARNTAAVAAGVDGYQYYGVALSKSMLGIDWDVSYTGISDDDDCALTQSGAVNGVQCGGFIFGISKAF